MKVRTKESVHIDYDQLFLEMVKHKVNDDHYLKVTRKKTVKVPQNFHRRLCMCVSSYWMSWTFPYLWGAGREKGVVCLTVFLLIVFEVRGNLMSFM